MMLETGPFSQVYLMMIFESLWFAKISEPNRCLVLILFLLSLEGKAKFAKWRQIDISVSYGRNGDFVDKIECWKDIESVPHSRHSLWPKLLIVIANDNEKLGDVNELHEIEMCR